MGTIKYDVGLLFAVLLMALPMSVVPSGDADLFWHLKTGEQILRTSSLLSVDPFSFSQLGRPWLYKDVLADLVLYAGHAALGFGAFVVLKLLAVVAWLWAYSRALPERAREPVAILIPIALLLLSLWLVERPNLFSMALFPVLLLLCERLLRTETTTLRAALRSVAPVLLLLVLWAWLHRAALLGVGLVALLALRLSFLRPQRLRAPQVQAAWFLALLAPALCCLTPAGFHIFQTGTAVAKSDVMRHYVSEWRRLPVGALLATFPAAYLMAGVAGLGLLPVFRRRGPAWLDPLWHGGLLLLFAALTLDSVRWVPYLALCAALPLAGSLAALIGGLRSAGRWPRGATLLCLVVSLVALVQRRAPAGAFALGEARERLPVAAVAFLERRGIGGAVVAPVQYGGYLLYHLWPRARVLVDGRNDTVYPPDFFVRCLHAEHDPALFKAMRASDGATVVLGENQPARMSFEFLARDPAWALVYLDDVAAVYVLRAAWPTHDGLRPFRYLRQGPLEPVVLRALRANGATPIPELEQELLWVAQASPRGLRVHSALALYYTLLGPVGRQKRERAIATLREIGGDHKAVQEVLRVLEGNEGNPTAQP